MGAEPTEAVLLCGGESERLGFAKEMLRVDGAPLAVKMVERLRRLFPSVAVVSNRPEYLTHLLDAPIHRDHFPGLGPLAGIHAALARTHAEAVFVLGCDMPLVPDDVIRRITRAAAQNRAPAVVARTPRGVEPLCGVYRAELLPALDSRLAASDDLSAAALLSEVGAEEVPLDRAEAAGLRDVDTPEDLALLREAFGEVEPLPVRRCPVRRIGGAPLAEDTLVVEQPFALRVNGVHLVTISCLPLAVRELAAGFLSYMGLAATWSDVERVEVDYAAGRVSVALPAAEADLRRAVRLQISSTCGAGVYGPPLPEPAAPEEAGGFRISATHLLDVVRRLRGMAPVFARTGATHQAAFTDGRRVLHFFEDVGRHNAIDKVVGDALMRGTATQRGALIATGRLNAEMVVKALRQRMPVAVSRSAATAHAVALARRHGLTLVGFARAGRMNVYSRPDRLVEDLDAGTEPGP
ncbi:MAG: hypothetical protein AMK73_03690 [Planctomycetes bacterium SM23_32]|nr:MAG: hypothetical protein AMK73_03690 [Planctomycetes bacterium SM23_32]